MKTLNWSKPENLRFRDNSTGQIVEIFMPKNPKILAELYPIMVWFYDEYGNLDYYPYTLDGHFFSGDGHDYRDIIEINETTENDGQIT